MGPDGATRMALTKPRSRVLPITWRWTLLHFGQVNVRKSWPGALGSIIVNFIGEPQAVHCGPWFCAMSWRYPLVVDPQFGRPSSPASQPAIALDSKGSDAMTPVSKGRNGGFCAPVSAAENSVPGSRIGDWFDDCMGSMQFGPDRLHHPVIGTELRTFFSR
jgi:hypothetical protein